jgi:hypothetical protein
MTADHVITQSFYVFYPDGNRLELYSRVMSPPEAKRYLHDVHVGADALRPLDLDAVVN